MLDSLHLSALLTVLREGSFDRAAAVLNVTPSAISQRIKTLEEQLGTILIIRDSPCRASEEGQKLYRHALQIELLEQDLALKSQKSQSGSNPLAIAVNADSLATWFIPAIKRFSQISPNMLHIISDDQDYTAEWLRQGQVLAAVTANAKAVQGCQVQSLGIMRYHAVASQDFVKRYFPYKVNADTLQKAPFFAFNKKDELQNRFIEKLSGKKAGTAPQCYWLPSPNGFIEAAIAGLGWGMVPESMAKPYLKEGKLVLLSKKVSIDVSLYWQHWRLSSPSLDSLTKVVRQVAKDYLMEA